MIRIFMITLSLALLSAGPLSSQTATSLDQALGQAKTVKVLDLTGQSLKALPPEISKLKKLESLQLGPERMLMFRGGQPAPIGANMVMELPETLVKLKGLQELNLQATDLRVLPENFANLQKLRKLDLSYNPRIDGNSLSVSLTGMQGLEYLNLTGSQLNDEQLAKIRQVLPETEIELDSNPE